MGKLLKTGAVLLTGIITGMIVAGEMADKGEVVCDNEDYYVKAETNRACNWSYAKVYWKNPR